MLIIGQNHHDPSSDSFPTHELTMMVLQTINEIWNYPNAIRTLKGQSVLAIIRNKQADTDDEEEEDEETIRPLEPDEERVFNMLPELFLFRGTQAQFDNFAAQEETMREDMRPVEIRYNNSGYTHLTTALFQMPNGSAASKLGKGATFNTYVGKHILKPCAIAAFNVRTIPMEHIRIPESFRLFLASSCASANYLIPVSLVSTDLIILLYLDYTRQVRRCLYVPLNEFDISYLQPSEEAKRSMRYPTLQTIRLYPSEERITYLSFLSTIIPKQDTSRPARKKLVEFVSRRPTPEELLLGTNSPSEERRHGFWSTSLAYQTDTNKNTLKKVVNSLLEARGISKDDDRFIPEYHKTYNKLKLRLRGFDDIVISRSDMTSIVPASETLDIS